MMEHIVRKRWGTVALTLLALVGFASNSVLCRLALGGGAIDAANFTAIRLLSGAVTLWGIMMCRRGKTKLRSPGRGVPTLMLFVYAVAFSYAYLTLDTGTGAIILFGSVQVTMMLCDVAAGNRPRPVEWAGLFLALAGFVFLLLPGATAPSPAGFSLMALAGIAWGIYTIAGRRESAPLAGTARNFIGCLPFAVVLFWLGRAEGHISTEGALWAVLSGGLASGVGYAIWYKALGGLSVVQAAVVQLLVPVIAAVGGVVFLAEGLTARLIGSGLLISAGILMVVLGRNTLFRPRVS